MDTVWTPETLRAFEEEVKEAFLRGEIRAPVHLAGGNENQLIEIFKKVNSADWVCGTHRAHYHCLLKGVPVEVLKAEIVAGWSMHLNFPDHRIVTSAIVGGIAPIALGLAMAVKRKSKGKSRVWCFIGDMAWQTGIVRECLEYAWGFNLPLHLIVECNGLSTDTPTDTTWGHAHDHNIKRGVQREFNWRPGPARVFRYCYERVYPHVGVGEWVTFA